jgi:hypothetical protein
MPTSCWHDASLIISHSRPFKISHHFTPHPQHCTKAQLFAQRAPTLNLLLGLRGTVHRMSREAVSYTVQIMQQACESAQPLNNQTQTWGNAAVGVRLSQRMLPLVHCSCRNVALLNHTRAAVAVSAVAYICTQTDSHNTHAPAAASRTCAINLFLLTHRRHRQHVPYCACTQWSATSHQRIIPFTAP